MVTALMEKSHFSINFVMNFHQVSENQNCATILPFDRKKKQKVYLKKKKKYVTVDAKEFMGGFL